MPATVFRRAFLEVGLACLAGLAFYAAGSCSLRRTRLFLMDLPRPPRPGEIATAELARLTGLHFDAQERAAWQLLAAA